MAWSTADTYTSGQILTAVSLNKISEDVNILGAAWTTWTPTIAQSGATISSYHTRNGKYLQWGKTVIAMAQVRINSVTGGTTNTITCTLPVNAVQTSGFTDNAFYQYSVGSGTVLDAGANLYLAEVFLASQSTVLFVGENVTARNFALATQDSFYFSLMYEAA